MKVDLRILRLILQFPISVGLVIFSSAFGAILAIAQAFYLAKIVNAIFLEGKLIQDLDYPFGLLLGTVFGRVVFQFISESSAKYTAALIKANLREKLSSAFLKNGDLVGNDLARGELISTALEGVEMLDGYVSQYLPQIITAGILPAATLIWIFPLDFLSGVIFLLTAPLIPIFMVLIGKASEKASTRQWISLSRMSGFLLDLLQGITTLKNLGRSKEQIERVSSVSGQYRKATMSVLKITLLSALVLELVASLSTAVVAVEIGLRLLYSLMNFEQAFFILLLAPEYYLPLRQLSARYHASIAGVSAANSIFEVLNHPSSPRPAKELPIVVVSQKESPPLMREYSIRFDKVSYQYADRDQAGVKDINFELRKGEKIVLVGESGGGKTTLLRLLMRFMDPVSGKILLHHQDGERDIRMIGLEDWRKQVSWVPAKGWIFAGTLAENLRIATKENIDTEQILQILDLLRLREWLRSLPKGIDSWLGEGGVNLSAGQAQRIQLARALIKDAPLLIMDEPTAHLDPETEEILQPIIHQLMKDRTVLVAAHRLRTIALADRVLVIQAGHIAEEIEPVIYLQRFGYSKRPPYSIFGAS